MLRHARVLLKGALIKIKIFLYGIFILLVSCKPVSEYGEQFLNAAPTEPAELSDVSISSNNSWANFAKTGDIITLNFNSSEELETYAAVIQGVPVTVNDLGGMQYQAAYTVTGLEPEGLVDFEISYLDINNLKAEVFATDDASSVTIKTTSSAPDTIALKTPASSPGLSATPQFTISGLENQATIKLYSDVCSTLVGTQTSSGDSVDITSSTLAVGTYSFYAKQVDFLGNESPCSIVNVAYEKINQPFISTWRTTASNESITLPLHYEFNYNMTVDWGDGSPEQEITSWDDVHITHVYSTAGDYTITLTGICEAWYFNNTGDKSKIISIENLGDMGWLSFKNAFFGASNLTEVYGGEMGKVTDMSAMFYNANMAQPDTSSWDTSNVTNMAAMFYNALLAAPDTSNWVTSSVINMGSIFSSAALANPDTSNWDTSSVTSMNRMFYNADSANPDTSTWDTSNVMNMSSMFQNADIANPNTSNWNTSQATNMSRMFLNTVSADPDTSTWDTSNVTNMSYMFKLAYSAAPNTANWNMANVTNTNSMFQSSAANPDTSNWDTSKITDMAWMFQNTRANPDTSNWNTSSVTTMAGMFNGASVANPDTATWDTSNVTSMADMFSGARNANPETSNWNTANVTNMRKMFYHAEAANPNTSGWNTSKVTNMFGMFEQTVLANPDTSMWDTSSVTNMGYMFQWSDSANPDTSNWDTSSVISMHHMFYYASAADPFTGNWNTASVKTMYGMFRGAALANPDTSGWNTSNVTNMSFMFSGATAANPNMSAWNISNVTSMHDMFYATTLPTATYSDFLINAAAQTTQANVPLHGGGSMYNLDGAAARDTLIGRGWVITDGGPE